MRERSYPYCYLQQNIQSIKLRFPFAEFYAKRTEKVDTLKKLLQNDVINLETLLWPKVEYLKLNRDISICELNAVSCPKRITKKAKVVPNNSELLRRPNCSTGG